MSIVSYKDIDLLKLKVGDGILYDNEHFYIKTPIIESSKLLEKDDSNYIYLNFYNTKNHNKFLYLIKDIERLIKNPKFESKLLMSTKYEPIMKIDVLTVSDTFFNKNGDGIIPIEIRDNSRCVCLLKYDIKRNSVLLYQYMKL